MKTPTHPQPLVVSDRDYEEFARVLGRAAMGEFTRYAMHVDTMTVLGTTYDLYKNPDRTGLTAIKRGSR